MTNHTDNFRAGMAAPQTSWWRDTTAVTALAVPLIFTNLSQMALQISDMLVIGRLGKEAIAGGGLAAQLRFILQVSCMGLLIAASPLIAHYRGARRHDVRNVRAVIQQGLWLGFLVGVPASVLVWFTGPVMLLFHQQPDIAAKAAIYGQGLAWGTMPFVWFLLLRNCAVAMEQPKMAAVVAVVGVLVNVVLNHAFTFGPIHAGLTGVGVATSVANWVMFAMLFGFMVTDKKLRRYKLLGNIWNIQWSRIAEISRLGWPIAATLSMEIGMLSATTFVIGTFSTEQLAAHGITMQFLFIAFMAPVGLAQASTVLVGMAAGRGDALGVRRAGAAIIRLTIVSCFCAGLVGFFFPLHIASLFLDLSLPENAAVVPYVKTYFRICAVMLVLDGLHVVSGGLLRGLKDTRFAMFIGAFCYWVVGGLCVYIFAFVLDWQGAGVWASLCVSVTLAATLLLTRFMRLRQLRT